MSEGEYVNVEKAISVLRLRSQQLAGMYGDLGGAANGAALLLGKLANEEAEDIIPVVRCKDCVYWKDRHIRLNDGTERPYNSTDDEFVSSSVGYNISAKCHYEDGRGWNSDKSVFRNADDYCSRGVRRRVCRCRRNDACDIKEKNRMQNNKCYICGTNIPDGQNVCEHCASMQMATGAEREAALRQILERLKQEDMGNEK